MHDDPPPDGRTVWTVGHSNHPMETLLELLTRHRITVLVDVRSSPYSRYASHFNKEAIGRALGAHGIDYLFLGDQLGGQPEGAEFYGRDGHVLYDRLAASPRFCEGLGRLLGQPATARLALMCGEEDPADCHRRLLIGRVLLGRGVAVIHIRGDGRIQTEDQLAAELRFRETRGQMTLFDIEEPQPWKSTRSVSPRSGP